MKYYTYAYLREDGTPYYIGKGSGKRKTVLHKGRKKKVVIGIPSEDRILVLKDNLTEEDAFKHKKYMIAILGRKDIGTGILRNTTDGGEGASGHKKSEEWKKMQSEFLKKNNPMYNPDIIEKMRKSKIGSKQSQETINKRAETIKNMGGVKLTEEQRKRISEGNKGKPKSEAHRAALKAAWARRKAKKML
jgi:hypothetical protein